MAKNTLTLIIKNFILISLAIVMLYSQRTFWESSRLKPIEHCTFPFIQKKNSSIALVCTKISQNNLKKLERILPLLFHEKLDINSAKKDWLELLPGIGPRLADRIISSRELDGKFENIEDIQRVKGIGIKTFLKIQNLIMVDGSRQNHFQE